MIKGCQKKIIHITNTGSPYFEEAYFILRCAGKDICATEDDMVREALRIAESTSDKKPCRSMHGTRLRSALLLVSSLVSLVFGTVMLIIMLAA